MRVEIDLEKSVLKLMRLNQALKSQEVHTSKSWYLGNFVVTYNHNSPKNLWGRFGGGWQWALGFEASKHTVILNLLVCYIRIAYVTPHGRGKVHL